MANVRLNALLPLCLLLLSATFVSAVENEKKSGAVKDITFDDIKFDLKVGGTFKRSLLGDKIEKLHGEKIRVKGWILPSFKEKGITQFVLVRDNQECCFGPKAALYDCILVEMSPGKSTTFTTRPVAVQGKFEISEFLGPDGKHLAIYRMVGDEVK